MGRQVRHALARPLRGKRAPARKQVLVIDRNLLPNTAVADFRRKRHIGGTTTVPAEETVDEASRCRPSALFVDAIQLDLIFSADGTVVTIERGTVHVTFYRGRSGACQPVCRQVWDRLGPATPGLER